MLNTDAEFVLNCMYLGRSIQDLDKLIPKPDANNK